MKEYIKFFDNLPLLGKLLFCLPVLNLGWAIYRICKGVSNNDMLFIVVGILWIVLDVAMWAVDLVTTVLFGKPILS